jgi:hypothetical protein
MKPKSLILGIGRGPGKHGNLAHDLSDRETERMMENEAKQTMKLTALSHGAG